MRRTLIIHPPSPAALSYTLPARMYGSEAGSERKGTEPKVGMMFDAVNVDILATGPSFDSEIIRSTSISNTGY